VCSVKEKDQAFLINIGVFDALTKFFYWRQRSDTIGQRKKKYLNYFSIPIICFIFYIITIRAFQLHHFALPKKD